jgi:hypothetical protein
MADKGESTKADGGADDRVSGAMLVSRIEVEPVEVNSILVTLHYYESPDGDVENQPLKVIKFGIRDDQAKAFARSLDEAVAFNLAESVNNETNRKKTD